MRRRAPSDAPAYGRAFGSAKSQGVQALQVAVATDNAGAANLNTIAAMALAARLPTISGTPAFIDAGGLMAYGGGGPENHRRGAAYVVRMLHGEKPSDLPVLQPDKYNFVVNLGVARKLGLDIPASVLALADQVVE